MGVILRQKLVTSLASWYHGHERQGDPFQWWKASGFRWKVSISHKDSLGSLLSPLPPANMTIIHATAKCCSNSSSYISGDTACQFAITQLSHASFFSTFILLHLFVIHPLAALPCEFYSFYMGLVTV